jgi:aryl-alcohol dehydrogenase-like predicted oxidoreductase
VIDREASEHLIPWCASHRTGVICYSPMESGLLTESFSAEHVRSLASDDWRRQSAQFQPPQLEKNLALRDALRPIAKRQATTTSAVAVAWVLAGPVRRGRSSARALQNKSRAGLVRRH